MSNSQNFLEYVQYLNEYSQQRTVHLSGRGSKWKLIVEPSHNLPMIKIHGDNLLDVISKFKTFIEKKEDQCTD